MPDEPLPLPSTDDLQFHTAEPVDTMAAAPSQSCVLCHQPIVSTYFALGDGLLCPACAELARTPAAGSRLWRLAKASLFGLGAGLLGALIWFAIRRITNYEIGLVAIVVGILVGKAVHKGSAGVGGLGYQLLAVGLTYGCIAANYMPDIIESMIQDAREQRAAAQAHSGAGAAGANQAAVGDPADDPTAGAAQDPPTEFGLGKSLFGIVVLLGIVFAFALATPFMAGAENLIGLLIIGFALWEAWKLNARRPLPISGPYQLGPGPAPSPVA